MKRDATQRRGEILFNGVFIVRKERIVREKKGTGDPGHCPVRKPRYLEREVRKTCGRLRDGEGESGKKKKNRIPEEVGTPELWC